MKSAFAPIKLVFFCPWAIFLVLGAFITPIKAQNLVPNHGFEFYNICPPWLGAGGPLEAIPWTSPGTGTADYFNACSDPIAVGVPTNFQGYQFAHMGLAYTGIYTRTENGFYREYIQVQLTAPLRKDTCYKVSFYINLANEGCGANRIGALLSVTPPPFLTGASPQIDDGQFWTDTVEWVQIFGYFKASGGEEYISIGNFHNDAQTQLDPDCQNQFQFAYYYIDDVSVEHVPIEQVDVNLMGPVTTCDSFVIDPELPDATFHWSDGSSGPTLTVYTSGTYSVTAYYGCTTDEASIDVTLLHTEIVELGPDSLVLCSGDSHSYSFDPSLGQYEWQDGSHNFNYTITTPGTYQVTLENDCGATTDQIEVVFIDPPEPFTLGEDTHLCPGDQINIQLDPALGDFLWQNNSTSSTYLITGEGTYSLTISNECGEETDEIEIEAINLPFVSLGPDSTIICDDIALEFQFEPSIGQYIWQDGSTDPFYTIDEEGSYSVTVSNVCGFDSSRIYVDQINSPVIELGMPLEACEGDLVILSGGNNIGSYLWQNGDTNMTLTVSISGNYSLTITNACGQDMDNTSVNFIPDVISPQLGPDLTLCPGENFVFHVAQTGAHYLWNNMSIADSLIVNFPGSYSVQVYNDCSSYSDTVVVNYSNNPPVLDLPADFVLCQGQSYNIDVGISGVTYLWNDGTSFPQLNINTPGLYSLTISNACGTDEDSILITDGGLAPSVSLGSDLNLCPGDTISLTPSFLNVDTWIWQDGSTMPSFMATTSGQYQVQGSNSCGTSYDTILINLLPAAPVLNLGPDTILCPGESVTLSITNPGVNISWFDGSTNTDLLVSNTSTIYATISNSCGTSSDTIEVNVQSPPVFDLGPDISICPGDIVTLMLNIPNATYLWQNGSTLPTFDATTSGAYHVAVTNACGTSNDTVNINLLPGAPIFDLGPDTVLCPGESITFSIGTPGVDIIWSDGSTNANLLISESTVVYATISNSCGEATDTTHVSLNSSVPNLDLGNDITICPGETITLMPEIPDVSYLWQDGSVNPTFDVTQQGLVILHITNECGQAIDTLVVIESTAGPQLDLGPDVFGCAGDIIHIPAGIAGVQYLWQDGSTANEYITSSSGTFVLSISNLCGSDKDTIVVDLTGVPPSPVLGKDTTLCEGSSLLLSSLSAGLESLSWQDGSSNPTFLVTSAGSYTLHEINTCGEGSDSIRIAFRNAPDPFSLGSDTIICPGESFLIYAPTTSDTILWQDGSDQTSIIANQNITYSLQVSNLCGNEVDSLHVDFNHDEPVINLDSIIPFCDGDQFILDATQSFNASYLWSTGQVSPTIIVTSPGTYGIEVFAACVSSSDQVDVIPEVDCGPSDDIYVPNVFTPNEDNINSFFTISFGADIELLGVDGTIFDRWGNMIFHSNDIPFSWDGYFKNKRMMPGVYVYTIEVKFNVLGKEFTRVLTGDVTLVR